MIYFEKYHPFVISSLFVILIFIFNPLSISKIDFKILIDSSLVIFSVLLGFLLTVSTLLHTIENSKIRAIKETGTYPRLLSYLKKSVFLCMIISFVSLIAPLIKDLNFLELFSLEIEFEKYLFLFLLFLSTFSNIRFVTIFLKIITDN